MQPNEQPRKPGIDWGPPLVTLRPIEELEGIDDFPRTYLDRPLWPAKPVTQPAAEPDTDINRWFRDNCQTVPVLKAVADRVDAHRGRPVTLVIGDTPAGSTYDPATNRIVVTPAVAADGAALPKLMLYQMAVAHYAMPIDTNDPIGLKAFNDLQTALWRMANPAQDTPPQTIRMFCGTNRANFYTALHPDKAGIQKVGLLVKLAGTDLGSKRWERASGAQRETKDQGWLTFTTSYDTALMYAREHTLWALGQQHNLPEVRDVLACGGMVIGFDVSKATLGTESWRRDNSGSNDNYQTNQDIAAASISVYEIIAVPGPLDKVAPPPMARTVSKEKK